MTPGHWRIRETTFVRLFFLQAMNEIWDGTKISSHRTDLRNVVAKRCVEDSPKNFLPKVEKAFWCLESLVDIEIWATIKYTGSIHDKGTPFFSFGDLWEKTWGFTREGGWKTEVDGLHSTLTESSGETTSLQVAHPGLGSRWMLVGWFSVGLWDSFGKKGLDQGYSYRKSTPTSWLGSLLAV